jgi:hypothetical protein
MQNAKWPCQNVANTIQNDRFSFQTVASTRQMVPGKKTKKQSKTWGKKNKNYSTPLQIEMPGLRLPKPSKCVLVMFSFGNPTVWGVKNQNKSVHPQGQPNDRGLPCRRWQRASEAYGWPRLRSLVEGHAIGGLEHRHLCGFIWLVDMPKHPRGLRRASGATYVVEDYVSSGSLFYRSPLSPEVRSLWFQNASVYRYMLFFFWNVFFVLISLNHVPSFKMEVFLKLSQESCHAHGRRRDLGKAWKNQTIFCLWNQISGFHVTCLVGFMGMIIPMTNMPFQRLKL